MIVVNGLPKSGTHAVMAWLSRMGLKRCPGVIAPKDDGAPTVHGSGGLGLKSLVAVPDNVFIQAHVPARFALSGFSVITILRDPRNVLLSYVRHRLRWGGVELSLVAALDDFWGSPFVPQYEGFLGWQGRSVVVRYENLAAEHIGDGAEIYAPDRPEWDKWIGNTRTGAPSDWRGAWNEETDAAWRRAGGADLLCAAGYASALRDEGDLL